MYRFPPIWQVFAPLNLSRLDLLSTPVAVLCMTSFVNVSTLNLSHNHITDLLACGIEHMTSLTLLDLHSNAIT